MFIFDEPYAEKLNEIWDKFMNDEECDCSFMRPEILESWKRSRRSLVDSYRIKSAILSKKDLDERRNNNQILLDTVIPYMEKLYSIVEGSGFYLLVTDRDGYILHIIGDRDILEYGHANTMLVVGANRSEDYAGTNAIGTALATKKPIQIWRNEHYIKAHQQYACSGAPICDEEGNLLGCLNLTGRYTNVHPHTLGMVISAVDGIEKELRIKGSVKKIIEISSQRNSIIEAVPTGLILLNRQDEIIQINRTALDILQFDCNQIISRKISQFIGIGARITDENDTIKNMHEFVDQEMDLFYKGMNLPPVKVNMSLIYVNDPNGRREGTLIRLNRPEQIMKLVNKISGYKSTFTFESIIGEDSSVKNMIDLCKRAAKTDANVLLLGESGTGKEMIAQSIHNASEFSKGPFVAINCGALPNGLIESELFGYERGAFTGANKEGNPGKFELADGGTLFLDEIGDMPLNVQVTLLRVLQSKEIVRIGGKYTKKINVRIIAATNQDLHEAVETKTFRRDLFYRLNVFSIDIPPLRRRGNDIRILAEFFLNKFNRIKTSDMCFAAETYDLLYNYNWPGNVRELEGAVEKAIHITDGQEILPIHFPNDIRLFNQLNSELKCADYIESGPHLQHKIGQQNELSDDEEKEIIIQQLIRTEGNVTKTANMLGISKRTLYRRIEKYNISQDMYRRPN